MLIPFEDTSYRIFIASENTTCFICKQEGHLDKYCEPNPNLLDETEGTYPNINMDQAQNQRQMEIDIL